jgi:toxin-antitoxin system PIN domain toxin
MIPMPDVNVLVYAHRQDEQWHGPYRSWLEGAVQAPEPLALSALVLVGFVRVVTDPRIYPEPTPPAVALAAIEELVGSPGCRVVNPSDRHWAEFARLCRLTEARGKLVADAQHAAIAIAEGATWTTRDGDFARFERHGLTWTHLVLD